MLPLTHSVAALPIDLHKISIKQTSRLQMLVFDNLCHQLWYFGWFCLHV